MTPDQSDPCARESVRVACVLILLPPSEGKTTARRGKPLDLDSLTPAASRRAASRVLMTSSVFGLLRPTDRIPAYRLSGHVTLPDVGTVASVWRDVLGDVLAPAAARRLIVDLRSGTYVGFWRPPREIAHRVVTVRVLHEVAGGRSVVSHFNKATK